MVKNLPNNAGDAGNMGSISGSGRSLWRRKWQPTLVYLPGKFHGQRSLAGYIVHSVAESEQLIHTPPLDGDVLKSRNFNPLTYGHSFIQYLVKNTARYQKYHEHAHDSYLIHNSNTYLY